MQGGGGFPYNHGVSMDVQNPSPGPAGSYERDSTGMLQPLDRMPSSASYDSLFLPKPPPSGSQGPDGSRTATLMSQNYAFNPDAQPEYVHPEYVHPEYVQPEYIQPEYIPPEFVDDGMGPFDPASGGVTRQSTMLDSQQGFFSDFAGQQHDDYRESYGGGFHRYSQSGEAFSPTANMAPPFIPASELPHGPTIEHLMPLEPRDIPFALHDPHDKNIPMSNFDNLPTVLRHRARAHAKTPAYWVLDQKGKEIASITWDKLASRAEKVAQVIRDKSNLYRGDRVALIYREAEIIEFDVALMGCFIAGVVAVPINSLDEL